MYIRVKSSKLSPRQSVQIVRAVREGKRVLQQIVQHVGIAHDERQLEELKTLAQKLIWEIEEREQRSLPGMSPLEARVVNTFPDRKLSDTDRVPVIPLLEPLART